MIRINIFFLFFTRRCLAPDAELQNNEGDTCTNDCEPGNPSAWCGMRRLDPAGHVVHCVQYTTYGASCFGRCSEKTNGYFTCLQSAHSRDYWEKCGTQKGKQSYTERGVPCQSACEKKGEAYYWCRDNDQAPSSWDYCSPPGQVQSVQYTIHGHACRGWCSQSHGDGTNYWWCAKSQRWDIPPTPTCDDDGCPPPDPEDENWDYCSPSKHTTRYNETCQEPCASRGKDYFWCHTASSWDYCSPEPEKVEEKTCNGFTCNGFCAKMDKNFLFCETKIANRITDGDWWDYCWKDKNQCKASRDADRHSVHVSLVVRWVLITLFVFLPILCCCIAYWTQC